MIHGVGTDIVNIHHLRKYENDLNDPFILKTFTHAEIELISSRAAPLYSLCTRFAAKEAVFKSFKVHGDSIRLNEIEILENVHGVPQVNLYGNAKKLAKTFNISTIELSLSYDTDYAIAYATALKSS